MGVLDSGNTQPRSLRHAHTPYAFSDASIHQHDPRHLLAKVVQTRLQCRPNGLIKRDHQELSIIGASLGFSHHHTKQIITMVTSLPADTSILENLNDELRQVPVSSLGSNTATKERARIDLRALVGLCVWAASIAIALTML